MRLEGLGDMQGSEVVRLAPLFSNDEELAEFRARHDGERVRRASLADYRGVAFLGIDAGSTTFKAALIGEDGALLWSTYASNKGDVLGCAKAAVAELYQALPSDPATGAPLVTIGHATVTGYGEGLLLEALRVDSGEIETVAHLRGAQEMLPGVEFILDIGGQDMKCLRVKDGVIDHIMLNEACSSGCGSFIESFASGLNLDVAEFAATAISAENPVDLGSRCTVFMNSRVKQAQKEGATVGDIAAGLAISVIKNALFKVIKIRDPHDVGTQVIVQGGTLLNDAVLRAFEKEIGQNVTRPSVAGLMGAFGAALYAKERQAKAGGTRSRILGPEELEGFQHQVQSVNCGGCQNHCRLTVNTFAGGAKYIAGNRCDKPLQKHSPTAKYNLYDYKKSLLASYKPCEGRRGLIGIPMGLNLFELYPFWHTFFTRLGFGVAVSPESDRQLYLKGQHTIPSDTVCYPAKLMHGHIEALLEQKPDAIFYPCMSYNFDEGLGDNHYNCPVVAYYPEVLDANVAALSETKFIYDYVRSEERRVGEECAA